MRIIQISDTHISPAHAHFAANTAATAAWLATQHADLVVHTGDLCMDAARTPGELATAAAWVRAVAPGLLCVPGNHDVGDSVVINPSQVIDDAHLAAWRSDIGPDRWRIDAGGWRLIGLNAMLLGTGHADEARQLDWFAAELACKLPTVLFLHKPLFIDHPAEPARGYWTVTPEPRARLLALIEAAPVKLIASGHLHIHRQTRHGGIDYVWGPAASFVCGASQEDLGGIRRLGAIEYSFGVEHVASRFVRPDGLDDLQIDPVQHIIYPRPEPAR